MSKCNAILRKKTPFELLWLYFMVIVILKFIYTYFLSLMNRFLSPIFNQNFNILYLKVKPQGEIYIDRKIHWTECASSPAKKGSKRGTTWCMDIYTRFYPARAGQLEGNRSGKPRPVACPWPRKDGFVER